jgi:AmmeMemoRadiSam system protein B/AmmeMemoRadiSam system protein A
MKAIRKASCAGTWYPGDPIELTKTIAGYFAGIKKIPVENHPLAIIAPHAGYQYSGETAAAAYKLLDGYRYDTVVVVSPSHKVFFKGSAVFDGDAYETPLGLIDIDSELSEKIGSILPSVYLSKMGHGEGAARGEHALELQLPFLKVVLGNFKMVAIVMGEQEEENINGLTETLVTALKDTNSLLVASTDLSHFYNADRARNLDMNIKDAVEKFDPDLLWEYVEQGKAEACGAGPMAAVMKAAKRLGGKRTEILKYANSGEVTGDFDEVVGYLSAAVIAGKEVVIKERPLIGEPLKLEKKELIFTDEDKQALLSIARDAIEAGLEAKEYQPPFIEKFEDQRGVFVTLKLDGELRGCIGMVKAKQPLFDAIADMAQAAAFEDPRFPMLTKDEFEKLEIEISVLSPLTLVDNFRKIEIGRDGLMIKYEMHSGLLLPQVATENNWDRREFLENVCLKAGLPKNSFKDRNAEIYRFEAVIF